MATLIRGLGSLAVAGYRITTEAGVAAPPAAAALDASACLQLGSAARARVLLQLHAQVYMHATWALPGTLRAVGGQRMAVPHSTACVVVPPRRSQGCRGSAVIRGAGVQVRCTRIQEPPNVLTIQFKRFEFAAFGKKINRHVEFPLTLDLRKFMHPSAPKADHMCAPLHVSRRHRHQVSLSDLKLLCSAGTPHSAFYIPSLSKLRELWSCGDSSPRAWWCGDVGMHMCAGRGVMDVAVCAGTTL